MDINDYMNESYVFYQKWGPRFKNLNEHFPKERPKNIVEGLRNLADWFDIFYDEVGEKDVQPQADLRKWADELDVFPKHKDYNSIIFTHIEKKEDNQKLLEEMRKLAKDFKCSMIINGKLLGNKNEK